MFGPDDSDEDVIFNFRAGIERMAKCNEATPSPFVRELSTLLQRPGIASNLRHVLTQMRTTRSRRQEQELFDCLRLVAATLRIK